MNKALLIILIALLSGCATTPRTLSEVRLDNVRHSLELKQYFMAARDLATMEAHSENSNQFAAEFSSAAAKEKYVPQGLEYVKTNNSQTSFEGAIDAIALLQRKNFISPDGVATLDAALSEKIVNSALLNEYAYTPNFLAQFPGTSGNNFHTRRYIGLKNKVLSTREAGRYPYRYAEDLDAMSESAYTLGRDSTEYIDFERLLQSIRMRKSDLEFGQISKRFPMATQQAVKSRSKSLYLTMQPDDPLLGEDIAKNFNGLDWLELQSGPYTGNGFNVTIHKLRFNEKESPERTEARTVGNIDLSFAALLFVPRNASMQYDVTSSSAEIDYGFEFTIIKDGKSISKKMVRDRLTSAARRCDNIRYVNVFGGVGTAPVFPNSDVQSYCNAGSFGSDMRELRDKIYLALSSQIKDELSVHQAASPGR